MQSIVVVNSYHSATRERGFEDDIEISDEQLELALKEAKNTREVHRRESELEKDAGTNAKARRKLTGDKKNCVVS